VARLAAEARGEKIPDELPRELRTDDPRPQAEDVHRIVLHALAGRIGVVAHRRPDAGELAGGDAHPHRASADQDPPVGPPRDERLGGGLGGIGVVGRPGRRGPQVEDPEPGRAKPGDEVALQLHSRVIVRDDDFHFTSASAEAEKGLPLAVPWNMSM